MTRALTVAAFSLMVFVAALASPLPALAHGSGHNWTNKFKLVHNWNRNVRARCHPGSWVWLNPGTYDNINCTAHALSVTPWSWGSGNRTNASDVDGGCETPKKVVVTLTNSGGYNVQPNIAKRCED